MRREVAPVITETAGSSSLGRESTSKRSRVRQGERRTQAHVAERRTSASGDDTELWEEMDWVARECGLSPTEKAVLSMARLDCYSHAEIARELGMTARAVAEVLVDALRKARARFEYACSPRTLFWEEIRQKSRCIYQRRRVRWIR